MKNTETTPKQITQFYSTLSYSIYIPTTLFPFSFTLPQPTPLQKKKKIHFPLFSNSFISLHFSSSAMPFSPTSLFSPMNLQGTLFLFFFFLQISLLVFPIAWWVRPNPCQQNPSLLDLRQQGSSKDGSHRIQAGQIRQSQIRLQQGWNHSVFISSWKS